MAHHDSSPEMSGGGPIPCVMPAIPARCKFENFRLTLYPEGSTPDRRFIMKPRFIRLSFSLIVLVVATALLQAQDIASFDKQITVKKLANGLTLLIMERREAPVFSFYTHVDAGSTQEVNGITGLAHMFEHMAFKGTDKIGTANYPAEKAALARVETAYAAYQHE